MWMRKHCNDFMFYPTRGEHSLIRVKKSLMPLAEAAAGKLSTQCCPLAWYAYQVLGVCVWNCDVWDNKELRQAFGDELLRKITDSSDNLFRDVTGRAEIEDT